MSTYVLSDIHGQYFAYLKMLDKIKFSDDDFIYVLGDCIDRGPDGINIIKDIMKRKNAELILGNHESMLLNALEYFRTKDEVDYDERNWDEDGDSLNPFELWTHPCNGGEGTCLEYLSLPTEEQNQIEEYLKSLRLVKRIKIGNKSYHLSHSYSIKKPFGTEILLSKTEPKVTESIVWDTLFDKTKDRTISEKIFAYQRDIYIVGHIFTQRLGCMDENGKGKIFKSDKYRGYSVIDVDCGMALNSRSSRLGCIRLEDEEEFYIPLLAA